MADPILLKRMTKARIKLLSNHPFFGQLALRLKLIEDDKIKPPTMKTNGKAIWYHPEFVAKSSDSDIQFVVGHEVAHVVLKHIGRGRGRTKRRWNYATDYAANGMLVDCGFTAPDGALYNPIFKGMAAEAIYKLLPEDTGGDDPTDEPFDSHDEPPPDPADEADWEVATIQAANNHRARNNGWLPGALKRFMDELQAPKVDWRSVMRRFATAPAKDDYAWARPNRKMLSMGFILPGMYSETVEDITTIIDTSGSIDQATLNAFGSEIADIRVSAKPRVLRSMYCDARVNHVDEFEPDDTFKVDMHGGGGTDFRPPFRWLEKHDKRPTCAIYLTDGYGPFPKEQPDYPVLWVMTTDVQPPWGECVKIEL